MRKDETNPAVTYMTRGEVEADLAGLSPRAARKLERKQRQVEKQERRERRARKAKLAAMWDDQKAAIGPTYVNADPLVVLDRFKNPTTVLHDHFRPVLEPLRAGFLCCGGPSYKKLDIDRLNLPGVATVGLNNTSRDLNVDVAVFSDPAEKFHHGIMLDHKILKLVPKPRLSDRFRIKVGSSWTWMPFRVSDCPNVFGFERNQSFDPAAFLTEPSACWGVDKKALERGNTHEKVLNTFLLGLRTAHYLGIRRLYLVGVDFHMEKGNEYAFAGVSGNDTRALTNAHAYRVVTSWCRMLQPYFEAAGFQVFNVNPDSKLDVWPYVPFDYAVKDAIGHCPQRPYDFFAWYDKVDNEGDKPRGTKTSTSVISNG